MSEVQPAGGGAALRVDRRSFVKSCVAAAIAAGVSTSWTTRVAEALVSKGRPSVIWLHFQECTGCTETLLRAADPGVRELLLELISLDYHETLCAAAGQQVESLLERAVREHPGYLLVVEGAVPTADGGTYCKIGDRTALEILEETARGAGATIAIGSCASFGGVAAAEPNPTGAVGIPQLVREQQVVTLPGCPPHPSNLFGTIVHYLTFGRLPRLDDLGRPLFAYGRTIHEHCPRRPHFDAGRFAKAFGDAGHRQGYCLYELGCKGPQTHAGRSRRTRRSRTGGARRARAPRSPGSRTPARGHSGHLVGSQARPTSLTRGLPAGVLPDEHAPSPTRAALVSGTGSGRQGAIVTVPQ